MWSSAPGSGGGLRCVQRVKDQVRARDLERRGDVRPLDDAVGLDHHERTPVVAALLDEDAVGLATSPFGWKSASSGIVRPR